MPKKFYILLLLLVNITSLYSIDITKELKFSVDSSGTIYAKNTENPFQDYNLGIFSRGEFTSNLRNESYIYFGDSLSFIFKPEIEFFTLGIDDNNSIDDFPGSFQPALSRNYYSFSIEELLMSFTFLDGLITLSAGKTLPSYGSGYAKKNPTDFIAKATDKKSKFLLNTQIFFEYFSVELLYGPNREFIPDDYTTVENLKNYKDFWLGRISTDLDIHSISLLYFLAEGSSIGLNYSTQLGDTMIPYAEVVWSDDSRVKRVSSSGLYNYEMVTMEESYFEVLLGLSWAPYDVPWIIFFEFYYNGDGYARDEWDDLGSYVDEITGISGPMEAAIPGFLGTIYSGLDFEYLSRFYGLIHFEQNEHEKFFDSLLVNGSFVFTYPFGLYGQVTGSFSFWDSFVAKLTIGANIYDPEGTEYYYYPTDVDLSLMLTYSY